MRNHPLTTTWLALFKPRYKHVNRIRKLIVHLPSTLRCIDLGRNVVEESHPIEAETVPFFVLYNTMCGQQELVNPE